MDEITIEVSDEQKAREVAYGILGRANDIQRNPDDQFEQTAIELEQIALEILSEYGEDS